MKQTLLLDCDGVLANLVSSLLERVAPDLTPDDLTAYDFNECRALDPYRSAMHEEMSRFSFWYSLPAYPGVCESLIDRLRERFHVKVVTAPYIPAIGEFTEGRYRWLENIGFGPHDVIFAADKSVIRGDVMIEDSYKNLGAWHAANPESKGYLWRRPWTRRQSVPLDQRIHFIESWEQLFHE